jgi:hypothetical protein
MRNSKFVAAALAAALVFSSSSFAGGQAVVPVPAGHGNPAIVWGIFGCVASVMLAAAVAAQRDQRELTSPEALTCGLLFWLSPPPSR